MGSRFHRPSSPGSRRIANQPGRSSTGTLIYPSSFDQYQGPSHSSITFSSGPRTSAERVNTPRVVPRYRQESPPRKSSRDDYPVRARRSTLEPEPVTIRRPLSIVPPTSPNRRPIITSAIDRPPSPLPKPNRVRRDEDFYIEPASSSRKDHRRSYTANSFDTTRLVAGDREARERAEREGYRSSGTGRTSYIMNPPSVRPQEKDSHNYGYEYTDPQEQMYRDTEPRPRPRRQSYNASRRERPLSMTDYPTRIVPSVRDVRDARPPAAMSTRGFANIGRSSSLRQGQRDRDDEPVIRHIAREIHNDAQKSSREPVIPRDYSREILDVPQKSSREPVVHQTLDPSYREPLMDASEARPRRHHRLSFDEARVESKPRESYDDQYDRARKYLYERSHHKDDKEDREPDRDRDRERERDRDRDRDHRAREDNHRGKHDRGDDNSNIVALTGATGLAGLVGLASGVEGRHRHHRTDRDRDDQRIPPKEHVKDSDRDYPPLKQESIENASNSTEASEEKDRERRERHERRRRKQREKEEREAEERRKEDDRRLEEDLKREDERRRNAGPLALPPTTTTTTTTNVLREQGSYERPAQERTQQSEENQRSSRHRRHRHHSHTQDKDSFSEDSSSSDDLRTEPNPRQVRVVSPSQESREPEQPIRGILRQPREKFPEDPAPVREGVAPLKDAGKKGIPPGARWTKIDRKLVNPEALEEGNERFEERPEYVIVLRVLTKEDIEAYAAKTQEIRARRGMLTMGLKTN